MTTPLVFGFISQIQIPVYCILWNNQEREPNVNYEQSQISSSTKKCKKMREKKWPREHFSSL